MTFCSDASEARGEPLAATASTGPCYVLVEDPGPWGPAVLRNRRLPDAARRALAGWQRTLGVRPLLIRRPERRPGEGRRVFVVNARHRWVQTTVLPDADALADLDLSGMRSAEGVGLAPHHEPVVLVCTHGGHDPCCAMRGRPVAAALAARHPDLVWEASHLGGDRFAGNMVVLPRADHFGRLDADSAPRVLDAYLTGDVDLDHHRGRGTRSWALQAGEAFVRRELGVTGVDDVAVRESRREGDVTHAVFEAAGERVAVEVVRTASEPALLTCHADAAEPALRFDVHR